MRLDEIDAEREEAEVQKDGRSQKRKKALLAFWRYKEDTKEFDCFESFRIDEPLPFKDMNYFSGKRN